MKNLPQWLDYIESLHPEHIELGLTRLQKVAAALSVTQFTHPVITVAGTNGKGSTVAMLSSLAKTSKIPVAAYTSPHIFDFRERLLINDQMLDENEWCDAFSQVESARESIRLTYFEFVTLAALVLIRLKLSSEEQALIVLEIGLGGRLDAVNVVENSASVITSIALDHQDWLGDTLESIAFEKSGVIRDKTPVIIGSDATAKLVEPHLGQHCLSQVATSAYPLIESRSVQAVSNTTGFSEKTEVGHTSDWFEHKVNEPPHQTPSQFKDDRLFDIQRAGEAIASVIHPVSFRCALLVFEELFGRCTLDVVQQASRNVELNGRWQTLPEFKNVWFDVAHNPESIENLLDKMKRESSIDEWIALCGMLQDKEAIDSMESLKSSIQEWHLLSTEGPRGQTSDELANLLSSINLNNCHSHSKNIDAINIALSCRGHNRGILVFGSFLVVSNVVEYLKNNIEQIE